MQALGRGYRCETRVLAHLDCFLAGCGPQGADLTAETFDSWSQSLSHLRSGVRRSRMRIVRKLCLSRRRSAPSCFVPDPARFPPPHQPVRPYWFTEAEIACLIAAADALEPAPGSPLHPAVFRVGIVLLYTTGLRRGELLNCRMGDLDPGERTPPVRDSKFHKSRLLPLSASAFGEVERYLRARHAASLPTSADAPLLRHRCRDGSGDTGAGFAQGLRGLLRATDIRKPDGGGVVPQAD